MEWQKESKKNFKLMKSACLERLVRLTSVWVGHRNGAIISKPDSVAKVCDMNFLTEKLILLYEPRREKTGFLHMRKQRRRLASR